MVALDLLIAEVKLLKEVFSVNILLLIVTRLLVDVMVVC